MFGVETHVFGIGKNLSAIDPRAKRRYQHMEYQTYDLKYDKIYYRMIRNINDIILLVYYCAELNAVKE